MNNMQIIKILEDSEFAKNKSHDLYREKAWWIWGLGDDGELYFMGTYSGFSFMKEWHPVTNVRNLSFDKMKQLVKYFSGDANNSRGGMIKYGSKESETKAVGVEVLIHKIEKLNNDLRAKNKSTIFLPLTSESAQNQIAMLAQLLENKKISQEHYDTSVAELESVSFEPDLMKKYNDIMS